MLGPITPGRLGEPLAMTAAQTTGVLVALEAEGVVLRGWLSPGGAEQEWCDRRLLARIHRATLQRLRAEIQPVSPSDFMRFLFAWQHLTPPYRRSAVDGVREAIAQLDGFELAADAWDTHVLPARVDGYDPSLLDLLCYSGEVAWARLTAPPKPQYQTLLPTRPARATPIGLFIRDHAARWAELAAFDRDGGSPTSELGAHVLAVLAEGGALFVHEIATRLSAAAEDVRTALAELVWAGLVSSDGFAGLRAIWSDQSGTAPKRMFQPRSQTRPLSPGGRWSRFDPEPGSGAGRDAAVEAYAETLLRRYGIMCRRLLTREPYAVPWRELLRVYRRLEARGDVRGGRFVSGLPGEQFALPEAIELARQVRRTRSMGQTVAISAADPLNLVGIITPGDRIPSVASTRIVYRDGVPMTSTVDAGMSGSVAAG
jgi:ATP-dependent Lhr-like helicase